MKRFILSTFSVLLATGAIAPVAQAFPQVDSAFKLQTLRLGEFDARNKSEDYQAPYYPYGQPQVQTPAQSSVQPSATTPTVEQVDLIDADATTVVEASEEANAARPQGLSFMEQRHQSLDQS